MSGLSCSDRTWNAFAAVVELEGEIVSVLELSRRRVANAYLDQVRSEVPRVHFFVTEAMFGEATGFDAETSSRLWTRWVNAVGAARHWGRDGNVRISLEIPDLAIH
jgi:hypothetical protein